jgi:high-affinity Fe2+/Pb2+ permease
MYGPSKGEIRLLFGLAMFGLFAVVAILVTGGVWLFLRLLVP